MSKRTGHAPCSIEGCNNPHDARGWCTTHYMRWRKFGDPLIVPRHVRKRASPRTRFLRFVERDDETGCWLWTGYRTRAGYGTFQTSERRANGSQISVPAHRWSYEHFVGAIEHGLFVCHRCDTPRCVNPQHFFLGSQADNIADAMSKGRNPRGQRHGQAKLTEKDVLELRALAATGASHATLQRRFGLGSSQVSRIVTRQAWRHI